MSEDDPRIDKARAKAILFEEAARAGAGFIDPAWERLIDTFSQACENSSRTHIAFLGTAILAKCIDVRFDAFAVKEAESDRAYAILNAEGRLVEEGGGLERGANKCVDGQVQQCGGVDDVRCDRRRKRAQQSRVPARGMGEGVD